MSEPTEFPESPQACLDRVYDWFLRQRKPQALKNPEDPSEGCVYHGETSDCRCAVGCLVSPEVALRFENFSNGNKTMVGGGISVGGILAKFKQEFPDWVVLNGGVNEKFLYAMQIAHDSPPTYDDPKDFYERLDVRLRRIAKVFKLDYPAVSAA